MALSDNLRGSLWMTASMAGFAIEDMCVKAAAESLPLGEVLALFGLLGLAAFAVMTRRQGSPVWTRGYLGRTLLIRSGFEAAGRLFYALAFVLTPLTVASAILQATPLVVVAGAALILGEKVGWRRWSAVGVGFAGVLLILQPGVAGWDVLSLLAVAGMVGFAGRDLATRAAPPHLSNMQLGVAGFAILALVGVGLAAVERDAAVPGPAAVALIVAAGAAGVSAYFSLTVAMRTGDVGAVTPFRYTRLIFAMILGIAVFGERPDVMTWAGSLLVVGSGTFALLRARRPAPLDIRASGSI